MTRHGRKVQALALADVSNLEVHRRVKQGFIGMLVLFAFPGKLLTFTQSLDIKLHSISCKCGIYRDADEHIICEIWKYALFLISRGPPWASFLHLEGLCDIGLHLLAITILFFGLLIHVYFLVRAKQLVSLPRTPGFLVKQSCVERKYRIDYDLFSFFPPVKHLFIRISNLQDPLISMQGTNDLHSHWQLDMRISSA